MATPQMFGTTTVSGSTIYGFYDNDTLFQDHAPRIAKLSATKLGWPTVSVNITDQTIYFIFEDAINQFLNEVRTLTAKNYYYNILGKPKGSLDMTREVAGFDGMDFMKRIGNAYATEMGVGGETDFHTASITLVLNQQHYDLSHLSIDNKQVEVREVFWDPTISSTAWYPWAMQFQFAPFGYFGVGAMGFNSPFSMSRGAIFQQYGATFKKIYSSHYSWKVRNNTITLYPAPSGNMAGQTCSLVYTLGIEVGDSTSSSVIDNTGTFSGSGEWTTGSDSGSMSVTTGLMYNSMYSVLSGRFVMEGTMSGSIGLYNWYLSGSYDNNATFTGSGYITGSDKNTSASYGITTFTGSLSNNYNWTGTGSYTFTSGSLLGSLGSYTLSGHYANSTMGEFNSGSIVDISDIPYGFKTYSELNALAQEWIKKLCVAETKMAYANSMIKYNNTVPTQGLGNVIMGGTAFFSQGEKEKDKLMSELKEVLEGLNIEAMAEKIATLSEKSKAAFANAPGMIYVF